jgi:heme exporter protein C
MQPQPSALKALNWITSALFAVALYMVLFYAPREAVMGEVQRIFYFHVAAGWVGALAFMVTAVTGIFYLLRGERHWDVIALASVEIGVVFTFINIVTGSIWARPIWNTWWTWDPRLVTATVMELIYVAYLMLRQGIEDPDRRARFAAVYGIVGFLSVPLTFLSIRIFRTIHPVVVGNSDPTAQGTFDMTPIYVTLVWHRIRLQFFADRVAERKMEALTA